MPSDAQRLMRRLEHVVHNIDAARRFVSGLTFEQFITDDRTVYAVIRALEIISEASRHVPDEIKSRYPDVPWQQIKTAGNVYRHGYEEVTEQVIWNTVHQHLDKLNEAALAEIEHLRP